MISWPERMKGESFRDYKDRRKKENKEVKDYLKGRLFWDSRQYGTYRRDRRDEAR